MRCLYALHDSDKTLKAKGCYPVLSICVARKHNSKGYGIFIPVNDFKSEKRVKENIESLNAVYIDLDDGNKVEQMFKLEKSPLVPSAIVESKNGFHAYWTIENNLIEEFGHDNAIEIYEKFIQFHLIPHFDSDSQATGCTRLLRAPDFFHCKNPSDKFKVRVFLETNRQYNFSELLSAFPQKLEYPVEKKIDSSEMVILDDDNIWSAAAGISCEYGLSVLSGTNEVNQEVFNLRPQRTGKQSIIINGKSANCWLDESGMIGSASGAGPTIANWLHYYLKDWAQVAIALKKYFPEVEKSVVDLGLTRIGDIDLG